MQVEYLTKLSRSVLKGTRLVLFCPFLLPKNWVEGVMAGTQAVILFNEKTPHDEDGNTAEEKPESQLTLEAPYNLQVTSV